MRRLICIFSALLAFSSRADTMENYIHIVNQIPQMEMKADAKAQAWARSARSVMIITNESIAETLMQANELARKSGHPLFCAPAGTTLSSDTLQGMILQTFRDVSSQESDKNRMTVSEVALLAATRTWPCQSNNSPAAPIAEALRMRHSQGRQITIRRG